MKDVDDIIASKNQTAINDLMTFFSLGNTGGVHNFLEWSKHPYYSLTCMCLTLTSSSVQAPLQEWQGLKVSTTGFSQFYQFCDALEVQKNGQIAPEAGWGLDVARQAWADYFRTSGFLGSISYTGAKADAAEESTQQHDDKAWQWMVYVFRIRRNISSPMASDLCLYLY